MTDVDLNIAVASAAVSTVQPEQRMQSTSTSSRSRVNIEGRSSAPDGSHPSRQTTPGTLAELLHGLRTNACEEVIPSDPLQQAVASLINAVHCALVGEAVHARQHLIVASQTLDRSGVLTDTATGTLSDAKPPLPRGGLAPWQIRVVSTHIEAHLSESVTCDQLSALAQLSLSHFMRAFRDSFGCPPHAYIVKRRIERAQGLMLTTHAPLGQIALDCGLADQSHLSRLFLRHVGRSPAAWRRARTSAAA